MGSRAMLPQVSLAFNSLSFARTCLYFGRLARSYAGCHASCPDELTHIHIQLWQHIIHSGPVETVQEKRYRTRTDGRRKVCILKQEVW